MKTVDTDVNDILLFIVCKILLVISDVVSVIRPLHV